MGPGIFFVLFGAVVVGYDGRASFVSHRKPGDPMHDVLVGDGPLDGPMTAEVHFVIRCHKPKIPAPIQGQTSTFNDGCSAGDSNEGPCEDVQFSVFTP